MPDEARTDKRFGDIAVSMQMVPQEKFDRGLVVQGLIFTRTKVHMPIGKVLMEMELLTQEQVDEILKIQTEVHPEPIQDSDSEQPPNKVPAQKSGLTGLHLTISSDNLSAYLAPTEVEPEGATPEAVKAYLSERGVVYGVIEDQALVEYLAQSPFPREPFKVAAGVPYVPGRPAEILYHFDTDPLQIGTLQTDGTMDWKNRGEIPQVEVGDVLVEKTESDPGQPGMSVGGKEMPPPKIRDPQIKAAKGAERSEDGSQIVAKIQGTPKLSQNGKVSVFGMLPVSGDIGLETGHIDFDGYIETAGGVAAGYSVKGKGLSTADIQDAQIEITEDVICHGGIYGSTLKVGGSLKCSHLHNCRVEVVGDLVVEKEMIGCTIETNGRCVVGDGKIISCDIDAKKGILANEIGTEAAKPCELTVGVDRKHDRDMAQLKDLMAALEQQKRDSEAALAEIALKSETISTELGALSQEQEGFMAQKRQFEEQIRGEGPNPVTDEEEAEMLKEMIAELDEKNAAYEQKAKALMADEDKLGLQLAGRKKSDAAMDEKISACKEKIIVLDDALKVDPGLAVIKVNGTLFAKTRIVGPHKEITIPQNMVSVRVAEAPVGEGNNYQMKISNLR